MQIYDWVTQIKNKTLYLWALQSQKPIYFKKWRKQEFGGPDGKKLKIIRLKRLIDEIMDKPMEEQYTIVSDYFDEWKGDLDQVDDVLFMGIKV